MCTGGLRFMEHYIYGFTIHAGKRSVDGWARPYDYMCCGAAHVSSLHADAATDSLRHGDILV